MSDDLYKNPQSRKWLLTINNPIDKGYTHERIAPDCGQCVHIRRCKKAKIKRKMN